MADAFRGFLFSCSWAKIKGDDFVDFNGWCLGSIGRGKRES